MLLNGALAGMPIWAASLVGALIGALVGGGSLWLMGWTWEKLRGIEAMGLGDVKMMFMVGAYLGWRLTILKIFLGVFSGSVIGIGLMLRQGKRDMQMLLALRSLSRDWRDCCVAVRRADRGMVRRAISVIPEVLAGLGLRTLYFELCTLFLTRGRFFAVL